MWVNTELGWDCDWLVFTLYSLHNTPSVISSHYARKFPKYLLFPHHNRRCFLQRNIFFLWPGSCWWWECCMGLPDQWISCHTIQLKILFPVFSMGLTLDTESAARSDSMRKYEKKNNEKWQVAAAWVASPLLSEIWSCLFVKWLN